MTYLLISMLLTAHMAAHTYAAPGKLGFRAEAPHEAKALQDLIRAKSASYKPIMCLQIDAPIPHQIEGASGVHQTFRASAQVGAKSKFSDKLKDALIAELSGLTTKNAWAKSFIYDQGSYSSCMINAIAWSTQYLSRLKNPAKPIQISRMYLYFLSRYLSAKLNAESVQAAIQADEGLVPLYAFLAMDRFGAIPESSAFIAEEAGFKSMGIGYTDDNFKKFPLEIIEYIRMGQDQDMDGMKSVFAGDNLYATLSKSLSYIAISPVDIPSIKSTLCNNRPIIAGVSVMYPRNGYGGWDTGIIENYTEKSIDRGGHAIVFVGYGPYVSSTPTINYFKFANSWGTGWGDGGFGYFPETNKASILALFAFSYS